MKKRFALTLFFTVILSFFMGCNTASDEIELAYELELTAPDSLNVDQASLWAEVDNVVVDSTSTSNIPSTGPIDLKLTIPAKKGSSIEIHYAFYSGGILVSGGTKQYSAQTNLAGSGTISGELDEKYLSQMQSSSSEFSSSSEVSSSSAGPQVFLVDDFDHYDNSSAFESAWKAKTLGDFSDASLSRNALTTAGDSGLAMVVSVQDSSKADAPDAIEVYKDLSNGNALDLSGMDTLSFYAKGDYDSLKVKLTVNNYTYFYKTIPLNSSLLEKFAIALGDFDEFDQVAKPSLTAIKQIRFETVPSGPYMENQEFIVDYIVFGLIEVQ